MTHAKQTDQQRKDAQKAAIKKQGIILAILGVGMLAMAFAFVPLYRSFCQLIGIPVPELGTELSPQKSATTVDKSRVVTVRFIGNSANGVPIEFGPRVTSIIAHVGEDVLTAYDAKNDTDQAIDGQAVHTIMALGKYGDIAANQYVDLVQCFCFQEQRYPANTEVTLPLSFTIRNDLPEGVHTMTFAYTLFETEK